jgi:hypothetical protein
MQGFVVCLMRRGRKKCDVCGKKFDNVDDIEVHRTEQHPDAVMS